MRIYKRHVRQTTHVAAWTGWMHRLLLQEKSKSSGEVHRARYLAEEGHEWTEDGKRPGRVARNGKPSEQVLGKSDERGPPPWRGVWGLGLGGLGAWGIRLGPLQRQATTGGLGFLQAPITVLILVVRVVIG